MAVQSAILVTNVQYPVDIKVVISASAPFNTHDRPGMVPMPRMILGTMPPPPRQAEMHIREYMRSIKPGTVRSESDPDDLWGLLLCLVRK